MPLNTPPLAGQTFAIAYTIGNGVDAITTGQLKHALSFEFSGTITGVRLEANASGSIVLDLWKDTYANYPPTAADSICASAKPTLSSAIKSVDTTLTGWTKTFAAGDALIVNVDSASTVTAVTLTIIYTR